MENSRKAISSIAANFYNNPSKRLKVIGITGTNGKTSTAWLIASILKEAGLKVAQIGTLGVITDEKITKKELTTPDPITLHKTFALLEKNPGEEAGLKSATIKINGNNAYGWLKTESGIHRLVRISPFDSQKRRHTSFASVWVYPVVDDNIEIDLKESDCRVDTYRSSGAGGQHVNTTDSAVSITHMPSKIAVQCQAERSQHKNKATAWSMLKARLYEIELQKKEEFSQEQLDSRSEIGWGHQIRSYVLQPYQLVKDLRTEVEDTNPQNVLNGDLDFFLGAALSKKILD